MATLQFGAGYLFAGRYLIHSVLGTGGMGIVYRADDSYDGRCCAVKVMLPNFVERPDLRERFKREAQIGSRIDSEYVVEVFDAGIDDTTSLPYLVMELLQGVDLSKHLASRGPLTAVAAVTVLRQVALALEKSHALQIIHRDLKPENLFLVDRGDELIHVKVLDFGIAKLLEEGGSLNTSVLGTPAYMAPEQLDAKRTVSDRTDIYALGMVAYTLLVGRRYWHEDASGVNVFAFAAVASSGPQEPASARAARQGVVLPDGFDLWFARATACAQENRFSSATLAIESLSQALGMRNDAISRGPLSQLRATATVSSVWASKSESAVVTYNAHMPRRERRLFLQIAASSFAVGLFAIGVWNWRASSKPEKVKLLSASGVIVVPGSSRMEAGARGPLLAVSVTSERHLLPGATAASVLKSASALERGAGPSRRDRARLGNARKALEAPKVDPKPLYTRD